VGKRTTKWKTKSICRKGKKNILNKEIGKKNAKKFGPFLDLCVSSLRRGHANLLCIVPILSDVPEGTSHSVSLLYINTQNVKYLSDVGLKANKASKHNIQYTYYFSTYIHLNQPSNLLPTKK